MTLAGKVRHRCFGAEFQQQGRGYYVGLELLAIVRGVQDLKGSPLDPKAAFPVLSRRSHDAARRLAAGEESQLSASKIEELGGADLTEALGRLYKALTVPVPGRRRKNPPWQLLHLTPFVGQLVHWDAVVRKRRGQPTAVIEEYSYRGIGGYAHRLLRTDPEADRLDQTREALIELVSDTETPLGVLARATGARDEAEAQPYEYKSEPEMGAEVGDTAWSEALRSGVHAILMRPLPREKRAELLLHWVPYAMARHLLDVAARELGKEPLYLAIDFSDGPTPVRTLARRHFKDSARAITDAMDRVAQQEYPDDVHSLTAGQRRRQWTAPRAFFTGSLAMIGGLNAPAGAQHLTLGLPLLEAVVAATLRSPEVELTWFCEEVLGQQLRLVVDARTAGSRSMLEFANASDFEANSERFASRLRSLGLLQEFSDRTRMVVPPEANAA